MNWNLGAHRFEAQLDSLGLKHLSRVSELFAANESPNDFDTLAHRRSRLGVGNFQASFDPVLESRADSENRASLRNFIKRGEFHRGQARMPHVWIHDAESNFDLRGAAGDRRTERERAAIERIFRHPQRAEAEFFGALAVRDELARVRTFETDTEFANLCHRFTPRARTVNAFVDE